jgi:ribulose-phosphate 3-epimerase
VNGAWLPQIAASILTADFGHLDRVIRKLEKASVDRLHLDVMDGHFVPNITFGPDVVAAVRRLTSLPIDLHLMISRPSRYMPRFLDARPQTVSFHVEVDEPDEQKAATLGAIRDAGAGAGLAISPATPIGAIEPFAELLDVAVILTVEPGWGGQRFLDGVAPKIAAAGELFRSRGLDATTHVDGGVNRETATLVGAWGADVCILGSALFQRGRDASDEVRIVKERVAQGRADGLPDAGWALPAGTRELSAGRTGTAS